MKATYPKYKTTSIPWLPQIPEHWSLRRAKFVLQKKDRGIEPNDDIITAFRDGQVTLRKNRREDGFTIAVQEIGYQGIRKNDLVIHGMDAFAGAIGVSDSDGKASPVYNVCTLKVQGNINYFCYSIRQMSKSGFIQSLAKGIRERSTDFRFDTFGQQYLPMPPYSEQTEIANYLDVKIEQINCFIEKKETLIARLREKINVLVQRVGNLDTSTSKFWPTVPANWKVDKAKRIFQEINKKNFPNEPLLSATQDRGVLPKEMCSENYVSPAGDTSGLKLVSENDYVISLRSFQGGIEFSPYKGIISPAYTIIRLKEKYNLDSYLKYYKYLFKTPQFIALLNTAITGIRDGKNVNWNEFAELPIPIPSQKDVEKMVSDFNRYERVVSLFEKEKNMLEEYKYSLVAEVVTGKIKVVHD